MTLLGVLVLCGVLLVFFGLIATVFVSWYGLYVVAAGVVLYTISFDRILR